MDEDFASFRAAHAAIGDALDACTRPDWMLRLAWEALDHKTAAGIGVSAARILVTDGLAWYVKPSPNQLEVVQAWAGTEDGTSRNHAIGRAIALSGLPGVALAYVVEYQLLPAVVPERNPLRYVGLMVVLVALCVPVVRAILAASIRRRAARLDDAAVLDILLATIAGGTVTQPQLSTYVVDLIKRSVRNHLDGKTA